MGIQTKWVKRRVRKMGRGIRIVKSKSNPRCTYRLEDYASVPLFHDRRLERRHDRLEQTQSVHVITPRTSRKDGPRRTHFLDPSELGRNTLHI
jgi:hypothetical protein